MDNIFKPGDARRGFVGPKKAFPKRRINHAALLTLLTLVFTGVWISWIGCESSQRWLTALRSMLATESNNIFANTSSTYARVQSWVQYPVSGDETEELLGQLRDHERAQCRSVETSTIRVVGLPNAEPGRSVRLRTGDIHRIWIVSLDDIGQELCEGGDYYETDLSGAQWKSRPLVSDLKNGTYEIQFQVDDRFAGPYLLKVVLLYSRFHGLELVRGPSNFCRQVELFSVEIQFVQPGTRSLQNETPSPSIPPELGICRSEDYNLSRWSGRWTRSQNNESCAMDPRGRYQCLPHNTACESPWCEGPLDRVDSNGWVYSAHCRFKIFTSDEAWQCLDKKWLFSWGDSTSQHTWQNLLAFIMEYDDINVVEVPRRIDREWIRPTTKPNQEKQSLRLTMVYNGHADEEGMFQGLESLNVPDFRQFIRSFFVSPRDPAHSPPDILVMNSGLHDAFHYQGPAEFVDKGVAMATKFWTEVLHAIAPKAPQIVYRTSVATAGNARTKEYNPQKVEHYNRLFVDALQKLNLPDFRIVDGFDLTFPWHYDNNCSDGTHYGLKPSLGEPGHQYFVDHMFAHMLLNSICLH